MPRPQTGRLQGQIGKKRKNPAELAGFFGFELTLDSSWRLWGHLYFLDFVLFGLVVFPFFVVHLVEAEADFVRPGQIIPN